MFCLPEGAAPFSRDELLLARVEARLVEEPGVGRRAVGERRRSYIDQKASDRHVPVDVDVRSVRRGDGEPLRQRRRAASRRRAVEEARDGPDERRLAPEALLLLLFDDERPGGFAGAFPADGGGLLLAP